MPGIPVQIFDGGRAAKITMHGQQIVAPYAYDLVISKTLSADNVAVNFVKPLVGQQFVVTGILLTADKAVNQDCIVDVYSATSETSTAIGTGFVHLEILKNGFRDITGLNILMTEGKYLNAKTDDNNVFVTIMGYHIPSTNEGN